MRSSGAKSGILVAVLLLWSGGMSADDKNEARDLFDQMEKKLVESNTLQLSIQGKLTVPGLTADSKDQGTLKATVWIAQGNKARMDYSIQFRDQTVERIMVSNGTRLKSSIMGTATQENDTPKSLRADMVYTLSRIGLSAEIMHLHPKPLGKDSPKKDMILLSNFRIDKPSKIGGRESHAIHYQFAYAGETKTTATTLYVDMKTLLPVARSFSEHGNLREEYQFQLNEKIDEEKFTLPK